MRIILSQYTLLSLTIQNPTVFLETEGEWVEDSEFYHQTPGVSVGLCKNETWRVAEISSNSHNA